MAEVILCRLDEVPESSAKLATARVGERTFEVIVVRRGPAAWAFANRCPHFSVGLDAQPGVLHLYRGALVMCAHHSAMFRLDDGMCIDGPCEGHGLDPVPVRVEGDHVVLVVDPGR